MLLLGDASRTKLRQTANEKALARLKGGALDSGRHIFGTPKQVFETLGAKSMIRCCWHPSPLRKSPHSTPPQKKKRNIAYLKCKNKWNFTGPSHPPKIDLMHMYVGLYHVSIYVLDTSSDERRLHLRV